MTNQKERNKNQYVQKQPISKRETNNQSIQSKGKKQTISVLGSNQSEIRKLTIKASNQMETNNLNIRYNIYLWCKRFEWKFFQGTTSLDFQGSNTCSSKRSCYYCLNVSNKHFTAIIAIYPF